MLAERLPLAMGDSDSRVLVAAGNKSNRAALERHMMKRIACLLTCVMLGASPGVNGQSDSVAAGDWITFNRTLAGSRFSPLSEINRENVGRLRPLCTYTLPEVVALETGPLVIDGTLYFTSDLGSYAIDADTCADFTADLGGRFYAFDARSGQVLWQYELGQVTGGGVVTYLASGHQRVAIASGMKSPFWPGVVNASRIVVFGAEAR